MKVRLDVKRSRMGRAIKAPPFPWAMSFASREAPEDVGFSHVIDGGVKTFEITI